MFVLLSVVTRGARFFLLAGALNRFGDPLRIAIERHFAVFLGLIAVSIVAGFWIAARLL
jgi:surface polysaccharide O-acyltransferase-like enzyme